MPDVLRLVRAHNLLLAALGVLAGGWIALGSVTTPRVLWLASLATIGGSVQESSGHFGAAQTFGAHQIVEGILDLDVEDVGQFVSEPTARGVIDEGFDGGNQSAVTGKPNCIMGPQACSVEARSFAEGIVAAAMSIAGEVIQEFELAKDGEVGTGAESSFKFGQSSDFVAQEMLAESLGVEGEWAHNVIVPTAQILKSEL